MFSLLVERYQTHEKREDRRAGGVIAALYNLNTRTSETDPIHDWQDFFTEWKLDQSEQPAQTEEEMFEVMKLFAAAHPEGLST